MPQPRRYPDHAARQRAYRARQQRAQQETTSLPPLPTLSTVPARARWQVLLQRAQQDLTLVQAEMQAYWDARSAAWQEGERSTAMADELEQVALVLDDLTELLAGAGR